MPYDYFDPDTPVDDQPPSPLGDFTIPFSPQTALGNPLYAGGPLGAGMAASGGGMGKPILQLLGLLLAGGGIAGVAQDLFGREARPTPPKLSPEQLDLLTGAQEQFGQSQNILNLLLGGLQSPQIPPALSALVEQSFRPEMGNIASQAIESARSRGFAGGAELLNTGPGGAIAGPALANLQGQMAQAKLNLYQNNIANLLNLSRGSQQLGTAQGRIATGLPSAPREQAGPSILETLKGATGIARDVGDIFRVAGSAGGQGLGSFLSGLNPFS